MTSHSNTEYRNPTEWTSNDELSRESISGFNHDNSPPIIDFSGLGDNKTEILDHELEEMHLQGKLKGRISTSHNIISLDDENSQWMDTNDSADSHKEVKDDKSTLIPPLFIPPRPPLGKDENIKEKNVDTSHHASSFLRTHSDGDFNRKRINDGTIEAGSKVRVVEMKQIENNEPLYSTAMPRVLSTSALEPGPGSWSDSPRNFEDIVTMYSLDTIETKDSRAFRRIHHNTLKRLLLEDKDFNKKFCLIDCRYPYEYNGGHIKGATNVHDSKEIESIFINLNSSILYANGSKRIPIFYCEYSMKRGPSMATKVRSADRLMNEGNHPYICHSEMYVLHGGYNKFYQSVGSEELCSPFSYVKMSDVRFEQELMKYHAHRKVVGKRDSRLPNIKPLNQKKSIRLSVLTPADSTPPTGSNPIKRKVVPVRNPTFDISPEKQKENEELSTESVSIPNEKTHHLVKVN